MPIYEFQCVECENEYEELTKFDEQEVYPDVVCPKCNSTAKTKLMPSMVSIGGPTDSKMESFSYRAGFNMEKAKGERRAAEAATSDVNVYKDLSADFNLGEGVHDPETRLGLS